MLSLFLSAAFAAERTQTEESYWEMWNDWHKKGIRWLPEILNADEHNRRFEIFKDNVDTITRHNEEGHSWTMGLTPFADMTPKEFKDRVVTKTCADDFQANAKLNAAKAKLREGRRMAVDVEGLAASVDWVAQGKVTPVKNQGGCGSCWAFSTTGSVESRCAIAKGNLVSLSEQELVDCDMVDQGCNGGAMQNGFTYVKDNNGLCEESMYPYEATRSTCMSSSCTHYDAITGYQNVASGEYSLQQAVATGPVSIAIEADQSSFQFYSGGVLTSSSCGTQLDHGVLAVGYGTDTLYGDYWKVKNSWGSGWGEAGYIRLCRNCDKNGDGGQCGIAMDASYPVC